MSNLETLPFLLAALPVERLAMIWQMALAALPLLVIVAALLALTGLAAGLLLALVVHYRCEQPGANGGSTC